MSPDGKRLVVACGDGSARLIDVDSGEELCALMTFTNGEWVVFDSQGRFDGPIDGHAKWIRWVAGPDPAAQKRFKDVYRDPGLLAKYMGFNLRPDQKQPVAPAIDPKIDKLKTTSNLAGTTWGGQDGANKTTFQFETDGVLKYGYGERDYKNGTWKQTGDEIYFETNNKVSEFKGIIKGNRIEGDRWNAQGTKWKLVLTKQAM